MNPCMSIHCAFGEECAINKYGIARCECPPQCEQIMRPVCTKDGRTFPSECEMKRSACLARTTIGVAYTGICGDMGPCTNHQCPFGATCVERSNTAHCECLLCPEEFRPVCGSDGITYGNECKLRLEACKHRREIRVLYDGACSMSSIILNNISRPYLFFSFVFFNLHGKHWRSHETSGKKLYYSSSDTQSVRKLRKRLKREINTRKLSKIKSV